MIVYKRNHTISCYGLVEKGFIVLHNWILKCNRCTGTAVALKDSIVQNNEAFLNQTVTAYGMVTFIDDHSITLDDVLVAQFATGHNAQLNQQLTLKGRCIGYDDLFEVAVLDQSTLMD